MNETINSLLCDVVSPVKSIQKAALFELSDYFEGLFFHGVGLKINADISREDVIVALATLRRHFEVLDDDARATVFWVFGKALIDESLAAITTALVESKMQLSDESLYQALIAIDNLFGYEDPIDVVKRRIEILHRTHADMVIESAKCNSSGRIAELAKRLLGKIKVMGDKI